MGTLEKTALDNKPDQETLRLKGNCLTFQVTIVSGKDGDHYVAFIPSLNISGYGSTEEEAVSSLDENIETFCEDFMRLTNDQRVHELSKLGFTRVKYHRKNFSKLYVDENGALQGLENVTVKKSRQQYSIAC